MRSALGKLVRKEFASQLARRLPQFSEIKGHMLYPGDRLYGNRTTVASFFLRLVPNIKRDNFIVEYGWSSTEHPPAKHGWASDRDIEPLTRDGHYFRISRSNELPRHEYWWVLADDMGEAMERAKEEFKQESDSPIETLVRASSAAGLMYIGSIYHETPVEEIVPRVPSSVADCVECVCTTVLPYFEKIRELRTRI